jgi:hypothetical protein
MNTIARRAAFALLLAVTSTAVIAAQLAELATGPAAHGSREAGAAIPSPVELAQRFCRSAQPAQGPAPDLCQVAFGAP